ncbi:MAG: hypothetical protein GF383_02460 [Candidatus Lokiarchaeota archaeon]|nr:hypothetical protein [Candidatus Lokiarchaeota archaeon]MBD3338275.1 hypothetical protein [Candidatus Lokiarchaeota archaeon]
MRISVEDSRTGKLIKLDVKKHHVIERIVDIIVKHMGIISAEQRSYTLVHNGQELPTNITVEDAIHKFGLKEDDKLALWARVVGGIVR